SIGLLKLSPEVKERINDEKFPTEARVFLSIGKQHEGYWNIQKLAEQVKYCVININIIEFFTNEFLLL
ncbi:5903_t:CDS:1, partial [Entrophospora sp. SA101]